MKHDKSMVIEQTCVYTVDTEWTYMSTQYALRTIKPLIQAAA